MKKGFTAAIAGIAVLCLCLSCQRGKSSAPASVQKPGRAGNQAVLPITGSWINLAYKDVRNKYTNPPGFDDTDPALWEAKVREMSGMGIEYLVMLEVANDGRAFYPSKLMDLQYNPARKSPVEAILDAAGKCGMKVFLSTGWAQNQNDNLRIPAIRQRQLQIMDEISALYKDRPAFYGWYLPVENSINPVFPMHAVDAVNELVAHARRLTPGKKTMISPYGLRRSDFDSPEYEKNLARLKVDIIAYQDEVGCVREPTPLPELRRNWKRLREVHDRIGIELWANCETFTWEQGANDQTSALIPASYPRLLAQQAAASAAGVDRIISFMFHGIIENPDSRFRLGQPIGSSRLYNDYMAWRSGNEYWKTVEAAFTGRLSNALTADMAENPDYGPLADHELAEEDDHDSRWVRFGPGRHEVVFDLKEEKRPDRILVRMLNYHLRQIEVPGKLYFYVSDNGSLWNLAAIEEAPQCLNNRHDVWIDSVLADLTGRKARYIKVTFSCETDGCMDEILLLMK